MVLSKRSRRRLSSNLREVLLAAIENLSLRGARNELLIAIFDIVLRIALLPLWRERMLGIRKPKPKSKEFELLHNGIRVIAQ